ncbi:M1 family aminopeptidase [Fimbriimonas ginsengisoli]|uniref:Aminopeptidase N n=1 Tax=Fimbriimonas ginsengisoli Gsoil 348 TaxID=661478 RepID=A0A068NSV0_FIMGI|nr:M1 family aminopeptidase [Fimbriimonas ginsengisoli]AIE86588.1 M1 family peptidase [Fimbriimonas ginsengisoli Gsoil 348]
MRFFPVAGLAIVLSSLAPAQVAPRRLHFAPDRTYDLIKTVTTLDVDADRQRASGSVVATISMLRDGVTSVHFDTSADQVSGVLVDGKPARFTRSGGSLEIDVPPSKRGQVHRLNFRIEGRFFRWTNPTAEEPNRIGFCAEGLAAQPVGWAPPNDLSSTEISLTVPTAWTVISNGSPVSDTPKGSGRHTVAWRLDQPHAGYLNSLAAGPFDLFRDTWRGKPLIMTCPKGMGDRLESTFAPTKEILSFFSDILNFPYPWPKYAQTVVYEHEGYAEEDVSATQYPLYWRQDGGFMSNSREGMNPTAWVIAHETAHQWFGDTVTCKDWGDTWLNEGMATYMEMAYTLHSRGQLESLREFEAYSQRYFDHSRTDFRPVATNFYSDSLGMGGWTTYMKGGTTLDSLRRQIGDKPFYEGLHQYLARHQFSNVESNDLCEDLSEASGVNLHPWFDQWIYKPGHPVIDWSWSYDAARKLAIVHVRQTQDTSRGAPIFDVPTHVALIDDQGLRRTPIHLNAADQTFEIATPSVPKAVIFDPDHDFLRELPKQPWTAEELPYVFLHAPNPIDMEAAMNRLLDGNPTDETLRMIAGRLRRDTQPFPAIRDTSRLVKLGRGVLHDFVVAETSHANYDRRANAVAGLGMSDQPRLHQLLGDDQPYDVVAAALRGLSTLDFASVREFAMTQAAKATYPALRRTALEVLADHQAPGWDAAILETATEHHRPLIRELGLRALSRLPHDDPRVAASLRSALASRDQKIVTDAIDLVGRLKVKALAPELQRMKAQGQHVADVDAALKALAS